MRILAVGEGMVEFTREAACWKQGFGGDALNTAVHFARFGHDVAFASALGKDPFSQDLRAAWQAEGIDLDLVAIDPQRQCGIYFVATDDAGERSFTYWRSQSAARNMMGLLSERLAEAAAQADLLYLSLISVAILPEADREVLLGIVREAKAASTRFAFDSNFRPILWEGISVAAKWSEAFSGVADFGFPTIDDELALGTAADAEGVANAWVERGCAEVVVKLGAAGCMLMNGEIVPAPLQPKVVDTSGAGDSFNAAYLSSRLCGQSAAGAAKRANTMASWIVGQKGALPKAQAEIYE